MKDFEQYLLEAAGKAKGDIPQGNPYREIGFDGNCQRLGWVKPVSFAKIKQLLESLSQLLKGKENFIFIGMGGSINGIKPLLALFEQSNFFTLDSLDPKAINDILAQINNLEKTLVISISKSGGTKETQLLSHALKSYFAGKLGVDRWRNNFLWLSDPESFDKLDSLGWQGVKKTAIQADGRSDVGGRFSSPQTQIFLLPLFLLLGKKYDSLQKIYQEFTEKQKQIRKKALEFSLTIKDEDDFYFSPLVEKKWSESFTAWIVQLFQESLGSKNSEKPVKTILNFAGSDFIRLKADFGFRQPVGIIMARMYFYQAFVAFLSAKEGVNFVNQEYVEKYKKKMHALEERNSGLTAISEGGVNDLISQVNKKIKNEQRFIEIVLYFYPEKETVSFIYEEFRKRFSRKTITVCIGSDWNHQSYQAAFGDKVTLYALICLANYKKTDFIEKNKVCENIETLRRIALATYQTLLDKSILYNLDK